MKACLQKYNACLIVALLLLAVFRPAGAFASVAQNVKKGNQFYEKGMYGAAVQAYEKGLEQQPNDAMISFNLGTARYKQQDFQEALNHFHQALLSDDLNLRQKAYYNLGNTLYRLGEAEAETQLPEAVKLLETALEEYDKALAINDKDEDVTFNKAFVEQKYNEYKKALEEWQEEQDKGQQDQEDQQEKDSDKTCPLNNKKAADQSPEEQAANKNTPQQGHDGKERNKQGEEGDKSDQQEAQSKDAQGKDGDESAAQPKAGADKQEGSGDSGDMQLGEDASDQLDKKEAMMLLDQYMQQQEQQMIFVPPDEYLKSRDVEQDW